MTDRLIQGVRHEGEPQGKFQTVGGVKCYFATPTADYAKDKVILYLPDGHGIEPADSQLLCDDFARNGFQVVAVDLFDGDTVPFGELDSQIFDFGSWIANHGPDVTRPRIDAVIAALKEKGINEFATTGYCFGGRYVFDLARDGIIKAAVVSNPSFLRVPADFHKFKATKVPLLINSCEFDTVFPAGAQAKADTVLGDGRTRTELYKREYFEGCTHGFAVRSNTKPKVKAGKEGSFKAAVVFLLEHFYDLMN